MKAIAINASARRNWNTELLLKEALKGAAFVGAETEIIHLCELQFDGCKSCFACKKNIDIQGCCVIRDSLKPVLEKVFTCDVLILGSPIYLGNISGRMKNFLERLIFANLSYDTPKRTSFSRKIHSGFIYTMGVPQSMAEELGYSYLFHTNKDYLHLLNGQSEYMLATDTYQFDDYTNYAASNFNEAHKASVRKIQFPIDRQHAFEMGKRLCLLNLCDK